MKCNSDYHAGICPARKRNGDCVSQYPCRHKVEPPKPKTNADHIRSMTDGQLAAFLIRGAEEEIFFVDEAIGGSCDGWLERDELLDWLKQPYGGDT